MKLWQIVLISIGGAIFIEFIIPIAVVLIQFFTKEGFKMIGKLLCKLGFHKTRFMVKNDCSSGIECKRCGKLIEPPITWPRGE